MRAAETHRNSLPDSIMIGDKNSDMEAAERAGVGARCQYLLHGLSVEDMSYLATFQIHSLRERQVLLRKPEDNARRVLDKYASINMLSRDWRRL